MLKIYFLGDISFNNCYNKFYTNNINPFKGIEKVLNKADFNIGNLECLAKGTQGENKLKQPRLNTEAKTLNFLSYLNLKVVTLAHNHVYDNLLDGYKKTIRQLDNQKIKFIGAGLSTEEAENEVVLNKKGIKIGLLNFVDSNTNPKMPIDAEVYLNYFDIDKILKQVHTLKTKVDHVVVLLHWGGRVEEGFYPDFNQPILAKRIIDAGADLIVGGHSHTIQPYEVYKGKYIFYSLGNFCFDDVIHDNEIYQIGRYRKRRTIIPRIDFSKKGYTVELSYAKNVQGFIILNTVFSKLRLIWRNFVFRIIKSNKLLWNAYYWHLKKVVPIKMYFIEANEGLVNQFKSLDFKRVIRYIIK